MVKYSFYILIVGMVVITYMILPSGWKKERWQRLLFILYALCTVLSFFGMISISNFSNSKELRDFLNYSSLVFFMLTMSFICIFFIRYLLAYALIRAKSWKAVKIVLDDRVYAGGVLICTLFILIFGTIHYYDVQSVTYDVNLTDGTITNPSQCKIGLVADVHLGTGSDETMVDTMCEKFAGQNLDFICIAGDVIDMTSFEDDVVYFAEKISGIPTKYGIYYVEGNHEVDSHIDCKGILKKYGIICLYDEALTLKNGLTVAGREDDHELTVGEILKNSNVSPESPVVVISHQPTDFEEMENSSYLVLSGHTHGVQLPFWGYIDPFTTDLLYGYKEFGKLKAITTSGISAWGYRVTWPSYNEVCIIKLIFEGGAK